MLDPDIQALVEMGDLVAATGLFHQRHGGSVLAARKAIDAARWALTQSRGAPLSNDQSFDSRDATPPAATLVIDDQIAASLRSGRKIEAIKRYRELHGVGLKEAKDAVEAIQAGKPFPTPEPVRAMAPEPSLQPELDRLIQRGEKILAIKHYREITRLGLRECKDAVEARMAELGLA